MANVCRGALALPQDEYKGPINRGVPSWKMTAKILSCVGRLSFRQHVPLTKGQQY